MVTRSELHTFTPVASILQHNYRRHRATNFLAWRLRAHFSLNLKALQTKSPDMSTRAIYFPSDPFEGDINPGTADGAKLFAMATKDRTKEDLLMISQSKVTDIMSSFRHDSNMFCCFAGEN